MASDLAEGPQIAFLRPTALHPKDHVHGVVVDALPKLKPLRRFTDCSSNMRCAALLWMLKIWLFTVRILTKRASAQCRTEIELS